MCDTQLIRQNGISFFAKNSDREASEPQIVCYIPAVENDICTELQVTYLSIPQVATRQAVILSKPAWMWGAEMGVNDRGVVIGNEAIFSKLVDNKAVALLGMDLVRLGLERSTNARHALECITDLLETYGQGGAAGYRNKALHYDNSFVIADCNEAWVLETAGRHWVGKQLTDFGAISNALSIEEDFDLCSSGLVEFAISNNYFNGRGNFNFAKAFDTRFMKAMGCAVHRREASLAALEKMFTGESASFSSMASSLRQHATSSPKFSYHGNRDVCMHAGGKTRPSQTCGSMIVRLEEGEKPQIMMTGTSAPCLSLFQPVWFPGKSSQSQVIFSVENADAKSSLWWQFETIHRAALFDSEFRDCVQEDRNRLEYKLFAAMGCSTSPDDSNLLAEHWHKKWHERALVLETDYAWYSAYDRYWKYLNKMDGSLQ